MKIGILITTFLRNKLLQECLDSISNHWNDDYYVIVVDQNKSSIIDSITIPNNIKGEFIKTEFDIGALKSRNIAIKRFYELDIPYILMIADSIMLTDKYDFQPTIKFLEKNKKSFLCGFDIKNRLTWECDMKKTNCFELDIPRRPKIEYQELEYQPVDLCRNFFLAKTKLLTNNLYDEDRKLGDHESFFWRLKERGYNCFYCDSIQAEYKLDRPSEYLRYRDRFCEYKNQMMTKYNLTKWVSYSIDLKEKWNKEKKQK